MYWNIDGNHLEQGAKLLKDVRALEDYDLGNGIHTVTFAIDNGFVAFEAKYLDADMQEHVLRAAVNG